MTLFISLAPHILLNSLLQLVNDIKTHRSDEYKPAFAYVNKIVFSWIAVHSGDSFIYDSAVVKNSHSTEIINTSFHTQNTYRVFNMRKIFCSLVRTKLDYT